MTVYSKEPLSLPVLALRGLVVLEQTSLHFDVGRKRSIAALHEAMQKNKKIFLVAQVNQMEENPTEEDLYSYGIVATIQQIMKSQDHTIRILVHGEYRAKLVTLQRQSPFLQALVQPAPYSSRKLLQPEEWEATERVLHRLFDRYCELMQGIPHQVREEVAFESDPAHLFEKIVSHVNLPFEDCQILLECNNLYKRLLMLTQMLEHENEILSLEQDIYQQVKEQIDKNQREYYLREQMHVIANQLGEESSPMEESEEWREKIAAIKHIPDESREKLYQEVDRLSKLPTASQEANVIRTYLETALQLPWDYTTKDRLDLTKAARQLDRDHYGLEKVKQRILELLAVRKLSPDHHGQILCLVGPPGVGKTSIAKSIAKTMNRHYVRLSLGGVKDEAEIRGHRKTYVGAMPGRILNAMKQAKSRNPLMLLDEIDKMSHDFHGDPASAMLEVLDSAQNSTFRDHYLEIPFDLQQVLFVTTANDLSTVPRPLLDRMEVITLSSYTREEKWEIGKRHLWKKQLEDHGLTTADITLPKDSLYLLIDGYTREAGVRELERVLGALCRKAAAQKVEQGEEFTRISATKAWITAQLGAVKYRNTPPEQEPTIGLVNGLAWTSVGGELLPMEAMVLEGKGKVQLTGNLGDVMKESAQLAVSYVRSVAESYGIDPHFYQTKDLHIHAPEGAVPKDGPSAGVTMVTALVSALGHHPVRQDVAMTGEISLRGKVMAIGGLKEKAIAAYRAGIRTVIFPHDNLSDLEKMPAHVREAIRWVPVKTLSEVLEQALCGVSGEDKPVQKRRTPLEVSAPGTPLPSPTPKPRKEPELC